MTSSPSSQLVTSIHRVWKLGADIDTDQLAPGAYMKLGIEGIAPHCLEGVRPDFAPNVRPGDVIAAGPNFGIGSSREQAAGALVQLGLKAVIAPSFSGLYFRNAFNLGLLLLTCREAETLREGERITLDLQALTVTSEGGAVLRCDPIPDFLLDMVRAGGLLNQLRQRLGRARAAQVHRGTLAPISLRQPEIAEIPQTPRPPSAAVAPGTSRTPRTFKNPEETHEHP